MKIPIPQDFDLGDELTCFKVYWPDTPYWIGILQGLLTSIQQGRIWDEGTGSILGVKAIGEQIEKATMPLVLCCGEDDEPAQSPDDQEASRYAAASLTEHLFGEFAMSLCGYNPHAFKIENGVLYVRDFCGEWNAIGSLFSVAEIAPTNPYQWEDPAPTLYPCGKVTAMIDAFVTISNVAWSAYDDLPTLEIQMRAALPSVTLSRARIYEWAAQIIVLEPLVDAAWFNNAEMIALAKCIAVADVGEGEATGDEVQACVHALGAAMQQIYGLLPDVYYRSYWDFVQETIGANDCRLLMNLGGKNDDNCDCADWELEPEPDEDGWYLSAPRVITWGLNTNANTGLYWRELFAHDAFGVSVAWSSPAFDWLKKMSAASAGCTWGFDYEAWGDSSDTLQNNDPDCIVIGATDTLWADLMGLGTFALHFTLNYGSSIDPDTPSYTAGMMVNHAFLAFENTAGSSMTFTIRYLHNINSPSHGS